MPDEDESFPIHHLDLAAEARQYAWGGAAGSPCPDAANHGNPFRYCGTCSWTEPVDTRPTSVQALNAQDQVATAETQRDLAQGDADRHLRNARHLGSLLEHIARTLGANPLDLAELPALVDGCRTAHDQASIHASDLAHALDRAEAGATLWKTRLVHESNQLRGHLSKARCFHQLVLAPPAQLVLAPPQPIPTSLGPTRDLLVLLFGAVLGRRPWGQKKLERWCPNKFVETARAATATAEAQAGGYRLAYDHLAAVTRRLLDRIIGPMDPGSALAGDLDAVRDALSRDTESYLTEPYDDITADTRIDLTPAGLAVTSQPIELAKGGIINGHKTQNLRPVLAELSDASRRLVDTLTRLDKAHGFGHPDIDQGISNIRDALSRVAAGASVPRVAREEVLQEDVLQRNLALESAHEELAQYRREIDHIRQRFLIGRAVEETFTVGELLAVFRDGPSVASPARLSERREGEVIHPTGILDRLTSSHRSEASRG